jgi:MFS family permease
MPTETPPSSHPNWTSRARRWLAVDFFGIVREMRADYLPPLMVYLAAGVSGFTGIVESFFVKDQLGLSAAFLASLGFWAGLPWALKMPIGHLVDLFWMRKSLFVYFGALLMAASLLIMVGLTGYREWMAAILAPEVWYVLSALLSPVGFVFQDVVADAMTVEAVPRFDTDGRPTPEDELRRMHTTMQTLGRIAIIGGSALVAGVGGWLAQTLSYAVMYEFSLLIPVVSVVGVTLGDVRQQLRRRRYRRRGFAEDEIRRMLAVGENPELRADWAILGGGLAFVAMSVGLGLSAIPAKMEAIFAASLAIIGVLIHRLLQGLDAAKRREIIGIALIVFVFRAMPSTGAGTSWWQIDVLGFDEAFFGTLRQISSLLAIAGMFALRGWMSRRPIPYLVVFLSLYGTVMMLPFVGMVYGLHEWTERVFGFGARTIAIVDTMADSPLGQVAMIPMLAWIAREAPAEQKATYFAVMAAFTNLALSAASLGTAYLNRVFAVERGQYQELGQLMIAAAAIGLVVPVLTVVLVNRWTRRAPAAAGPRTMERQDA